jgi:hypothetical protein
LTAFEKIRYREMQMCANVGPALHVPEHRQNIERGDLSFERSYVRNTRFLLSLAYGHGKKVIFAVGMAARPRPYVHNVVVGKQYPVAAFVYDKT